MLHPLPASSSLIGAMVRVPSVRDFWTKECGGPGQNANDITPLLIQGQSENHFKVHTPPDHTSGASQQVGAQMCPPQHLPGYAFQKPFLTAYSG